MIISDHTSRYFAYAIVALFVILATWVSLIVPIFEAPDESAHYLQADFIARTWQLPTLDYTNPHDEYHQPPLYYWLNAIWINVAGLPNPDPFLQANPAAAISDTASFGNKNAYRHNFMAEAWPWRGAVLAVHLGRFTSIVLAALTVWFAYKIGGQVFPQQSSLALFITALVALNPQFIFISASLNNDNLATLLVTVSIWFALRLALQASLTWSDVIISGCLLSGAILAKPTGFMTNHCMQKNFLHVMDLNNPKNLFEAHFVTCSVIWISAAHMNRLKTKW